MKKQLSCKQRVKSAWKSLRRDLKKALSSDEIYDFGLSLDFVKAGTFKGQREDYVRYQFSWGGPSDELRFYKNGDIEYWFLDWFDGACIDVTNDPIAQQVKNRLSGSIPEPPWF